MPDDPFNPEDVVNIHSMTMEELRHEAARILSLYHNASDANEMLSLSTRYTKIDMLLDKREKLIAQGVPMSEIIERTSPRKPSSPPPPPELSHVDADPATFDTPIDDADFAEYDEDPLPEVKTAGDAKVEPAAPSEPSKSSTTDEPAGDVSALDTPTMEMNVENLLNSEANDSSDDEDTQKLHVADISKFEPGDEEGSSIPLSVPDINLESDSDLDRFQVENDTDAAGADPAEMPTPIMPLAPVPESDLETPVPSIGVSDVDLETPVPDDNTNEAGTDAPDDPAFIMSEDDKENTTIIIRKKKAKADFGIAEIPEDVGFSDIDEKATETGEATDESPEEDESDADSDSDTVIMRKKKFSFLAGLENESTGTPPESEESVPPEFSTPAEVENSPSTEGLSPTTSESSTATEPIESAANDEAPPADNESAPGVEAKAISDESEAAESLPAFEIPADVFGEKDEDSSVESDDSSEGAFNFDAPSEADESEEDTFDSDDDAEALGVLTTPFEATDAEMEAFGFDADTGSREESSSPEEVAQAEATREIGASDAEESKDSELSDFEKALASLNAAIEDSSKLEHVDAPEKSKVAADDSPDDESADATAQINASEGNPMVESIFDIDAESKSEAASESKPDDDHEDSESIFNFEVDTQIPLEEMGGDASSSAFADLSGESNEPEADESAAPIESASESTTDDDGGTIGNLPSLGDAIFSSDSDESDSGQPTEAPPAAEPAAEQEEASQVEAKEESPGLPAFELPPFDPDGLSDSTDVDESKADAPPAIPNIAASAGESSSAADANTQQPAGAGLNLPPIGEIPSLGSDGPPDEENKPIPSPTSTAPTTPAPIPPVDNIPPQGDENAAKLELKGHLRVCASCGEQTEITEPRCEKCFYLDNSLGIVNAVMGGDTRQVSKLLRVKPDILHTRTKKHNWTLLHMAASGGNMRLTKLLVEKGCDINEPNIYGKTALHYAASKGHVPIIHMLLQAGADASMKFDNKTPLQLAMDNGRAEAIAALKST